MVVHFDESPAEAGEQPVVAQMHFLTETAARERLRADTRFGIYDGVQPLADVDVLDYRQDVARTVLLTWANRDTRLEEEGSMRADDMFVQKLVSEVPVLQNAHQEHVTYFGELLPHVLMGDITRVAADLHGRALAGDTVADQALDSLLAKLERGLDDDGGSVRELIVVSFLENLDLEGYAGDDFRRRLGSSLQEWLARIEWERSGE